MEYAVKLAKIRKRDIATFRYHQKHPEARLGNARDRRAGYNSRQAVYESMKKIRALIASGDLILDGP